MSVRLYPIPRIKTPDSNKSSTVPPKPSVSNNPLDQSSFELISDGFGYLQRPWFHVKKESDPEGVFVLSNSNYKVNDTIAQNIRVTKLFVVLPDNGAGSRFIRLGEIPNARRYKIRKRERQTERS